MKKFLQGGTISVIMLLMSFLTTAQTIPPDATQLENIQITNNTTSTTATKMVVQESTGVLNTMPFVAQDNIDKVITIELQDDQPLSAVASAVNALAYNVSETESTWVKVIYKESLGDFGVITRVELYKVINKGKGILELSTENPFEDLLYIYNEKPYIDSYEELASTQIIDLGWVITGTNISDYVNNLTTPITFQSQEDGYVLIKVVNNGIQESYLFLGNGGTYGQGQLQTVIDDFQLIPGQASAVLQVGDNVSLLNNDAGYITNSEVTLQTATTNGNTTNNKIILTTSSYPALQAINGTLRGVAIQGDEIVQAGTMFKLSDSGGFEITSESGLVNYNKKQIYKTEVPTTFTGREIPDVNWVNAGLALKANDADVLHKTGNQVLDGSLELTGRLLLNNQVLQYYTIQASDTQKDGFFTAMESDYDGYGFHAVRTGTGGGGGGGFANESTGAGSGVVGNRRGAGSGHGGQFERRESGEGSGVLAAHNGSGYGHGIRAIKIGNQLGYSGLFEGGEGVRITGGDGDLPVLGSWGGSFGLANADNLYGINAGVLSSGDGWIQVHRSDGVGTAYGLKLQPSGGSVEVPNATASNHAAAYGQLGTGWANYTDTVYASGSPFTITTGTTSTLPNNAGTVINNQLPIGVTSFYNSSTSKITPQNDGDYYVATIRFKAQTTAPTGGYFDFGIDIGGALGIQFKETKIFAKGAGTEHNFSIAVPMYSASTFVTNGGLVKITSGVGVMTIYDISYQIDRTHKAK